MILYYKKKVFPFYITIMAQLLKHFLSLIFRRRTLLPAGVRQTLLPVDSGGIADEEDDDPVALLLADVLGT